MKRLLLGIALIAVLISGLALPGCIRKNLSENAGVISSRNYDNTGFTGVEIGSALKLEITYGTSYSVKITAGENLFERIRVTQNGDILKIYTEGWFLNWWWGRVSPKVTITMPVLETLDLSGASDGDVSGFKSDRDLNLEASGASTLNIDIETGFFKALVSGASNVRGRLIASGTDIVLTGASDLDLTGTGGDVKLRASGASTASLRYFVATDADVTLSGASNGSLDISGDLDADLSGASSFNYYGNPTLGRIETTGASDLRHKTK